MQISDKIKELEQWLEDNPISAERTTIIEDLRKLKEQLTPPENAS